MSILGKLWSSIADRKQGNISVGNIGNANSVEDTLKKSNPQLFAFVDIEVGMKGRKINDIGAIRYDDAIFHHNSREKFIAFIKNVDFLCGHNIIHHDAKYLFGDNAVRWHLVDTLYMSPLLFPERPYHKLVKDEKLFVEEINNPIADCRKACDLLYDEIGHWKKLPVEKQQIFTTLLRKEREFSGFLSMVGAQPANENLTSLICRVYNERICVHADLRELIDLYPVALSYALALIDTTDYRSVTPPWVLHNYPEVEWVMKALRHTHCQEGCAYCNSLLDIHRNLKTFFGYDDFRTYNGEPLQEMATKSAVDGKSLLAIFPTGGGKSLTFQLPALISGHSVHGLTVVISPLQSLMKDQVDNLIERGITDAVTVNGLLDPISRALAIERVQNGDAALLYISPEMLRSRTIERILMSRNVVRFVIDEAHCFSSWGQDFRVDYLYIGKFIAEYQKKKGIKTTIPISCFTATAKQKVVQDICDYFQQTLGCHLELFASTASRTNLRYSVIYAETDEEKYQRLRTLVSESTGPVIIYVSRTKRTKELAIRLSCDGMKALPFNGKMDSEEKIANQDAFMNDRVRIIVATSAFGMGVDKSDVELVIHYDISDSLENYVQEAGRAGRDPNLSARCYVLYNDNDLDKHFILLNQTKLSISEIQQVWKAVKELTRQRDTVNCSALEIARKAGWDDSVSDIETRVRTAISTLELSGYLVRGNNVPHVYATGITVKNVDEARESIIQSVLFEQSETEKAVRIIKSLISQKYITKAQDTEAESRVDYLADILGLTKSEVVSVVERMRQAGILADTKDISAYLWDGDSTERKSMKRLDECARLERFIVESIPDEKVQTTSKQLNEDATKANITSAREKDVRTLLYFLAVKGYIHKHGTTSQYMELSRQCDAETVINRMEKRMEISQFAIEWLYKIVASTTANDVGKQSVQFSIVELLNDFNARPNRLFSATANVTLEDVEEALLYLSNIGALKLDGGFLILYNAMNIRRTKDLRLRYKQEDYRMLNEFYKQKIQQVHIVGEYANLMVRDYQAALQYVQDYFQMDYKRFIAKYFKDERFDDIERNLTPRKYKQLFGELSKRQKEIISDKQTRCIVVAAGPGSGKTRVLVHKLASLLLLEDVKHEQLLMLTFSRAAATEFKQRLMGLIGNAAHFVEIKTFHSYCFDLLGRVGNLDDASNVVSRAAEMIEKGEVEPNRIAKTVLVIDEAQDMSESEYLLVSALMTRNEEMRVIAVGDDDQNIYEFRGSDSCYMFDLLQRPDARFIEMTDNYRSSRHVVDFANAFAPMIGKRMKTLPITSMSEKKGRVEIVHHTARNLYQPLADNLIANKGQGTACVLTQTNEESVIMAALLQRCGINARLVQSLDGFNFYNVVEVRSFMRYISKRLSSPLISDELWEQAKQSTFATYSTSTALDYLRKCVELFEQLNRTKYFSDFKEFVFESSVEDFCDTSGTDVVVSTIHKSKGREFDDIYLLISGKPHQDEALMRRYYVGITRAKHRLFIHTTSSCFTHLPADSHVNDLREYDFPHEVVLQLSHRDVHLDFFLGRKIDILALRSGDVLDYSSPYLYDENKKLIARLSNRMLQTINEWRNRGYEFSAASVRFIVAWKKKEANSEHETAVLLPDIVLKFNPYNDLLAERSQRN